MAKVDSDSARIAGSVVRRAHRLDALACSAANALLALRRFAEEADDLGQPAVGIDLADIDRRLASTSIGADQPPQEADDVVMQLDTLIISSRAPGRPACTFEMRSHSADRPLSSTLGST
jgi:hypothetical protein